MRQEQLRRSAGTWWSMVGDVVAHPRRTPGAPRRSLGAHMRRQCIRTYAHMRRLMSESFFIMAPKHSHCEQVISDQDALGSRRA